MATNNIRKYYHIEIIFLFFAENNLIKILISFRGTKMITGLLFITGVRFWIGIMQKKHIPCRQVDKEDMLTVDPGKCKDLLHRFYELLQTLLIIQSGNGLPVYFSKEISRRVL